jgi:hypothetical protein
MRENAYQIKYTTCQICGEPTMMLETQLCDNCWEIISRLPEFLKSRNGLSIIYSMIKENSLEK